MKAATRRVLQCLAGVMLAFGWSGCAFVTDLINPGLAAQIGLDPAILSSPKGTVMIAFKNDTRFPATFFVYRSLSATDLARGTRNINVPVDAGAVGNEVVDCPVALIAPGTVGQNFAIGTTAATVEAGTSAVDVTYAGQPLESGKTFVCGDVVEIQLSAAAGTAATTDATGQAATDFAITVQIIPGR